MKELKKCSDVKPGHVLTITTGEYSDYVIHGLFVAIEAFNPIAELSVYLDQHPDETEPHGFHSDRFLAYLLTKGFLLEIKYGEIHLGDYHCLDEVYFRGVSE